MIQGKALMKGQWWDMRLIWFATLAFVMAGHAGAAPTEAPGASSADIIANRLDDLSEKIAFCDNGKGFFCNLAAQSLATSNTDQAAALATIAEPGCARGDATACWQWGVSMAIRVVANNQSDAMRAARQKVLARATDLFRQACQGGSMAGCRDVARSYRWHRGVAEDKPQVIVYLQRACDGGLAGACLDLSEILTARYLGFDLDPVKADQALFRACELHDPNGCLKVADALASRPETMSEWHGAPAVPDLYQMACTAHLAAACNRLGEHYEQGEGVPVDDAQSVAFYRRSCDLGNAYGCVNLAGKLRDGQGIAADRAGALALFVRACKDYTTACYAGADLVTEGQPDFAALMTALKLYSQACSVVNPELRCRKILEYRERILALHRSPGASKPILIPEPRNDTYPVEAIRRGEEGRSVTHFTVMPDGSTSDCTASGTTPTLDTATCEQIVANLHYLPGTDTDGKPVPQPITSSVIWRIPKD